MVFDEGLLEKLEQLLAESSEARQAVAAAVAPFMKKENVSELCRAKSAETILYQLGIKSTNSGFRYLWYALEELLPDDERKLGDIRVCTEVYFEVAKHFRTSSANVEKSMRTEICNAWKNEATEAIRKEIFPQGRPTVKTFLVVLKAKMTDN